MAFLDLTDDGPGWGVQEPGDYVGEVSSCEERESKKGDAMFIISFKDVDGGGVLCDDVLMLAGKGKGMGFQKLRGLGFDEDFKGEVAAAELIGRRVMLHMDWSTYGGKKEMKPDIKQGEYCGYSRLTTEPVKAVQDNDIDPFSDPPEPDRLPSGDSIPF